MRARARVCSYTCCHWCEGDGAVVKRNHFGIACGAGARSQAGENFHYRSLMLNLVYEPGDTYAQWSNRADVRRLLEAYVEAPPENPKEPWGRWREHARLAVAHLQSPIMAGKPVRLICEVQFLLSP